MQCMFGGVTYHSYLASSSNVCSRLKTVSFEMLAAKNRILRGIPLRSSTIHLFRPFLYQAGIPKDPKKTNTVAMCVETRSSHAPSRHGPQVGVLSMTNANHTHNRFEFRRKQEVKNASLSRSLEEMIVMEIRDIFSWV